MDRLRFPQLCKKQTLLGKPVDKDGIDPYNKTNVVWSLLNEQLL